MERCPECGGPVDFIDPWVRSMGVKARPDTLEGIEADASQAEQAERARLSDSKDADAMAMRVRDNVLHAAVCRLMVGCEPCGRPPFDASPKVMEDIQAGMREARRQAFQQAAQEVQNHSLFDGYCKCSDFCDGEHWDGKDWIPMRHDEHIAAKLHHLAEEM